MNDDMAWHGKASPLARRRGASFSSSATSFIRTSDRMPALSCRRGMDLYLYVDRSSMSPPTDTFHFPCGYHHSVFLSLFLLIIVQGWYYRYSVNLLSLAFCPWQGPPSLAAARPSIHCGTKTSVFGSRRCVCPGGSGETNDFRAAPGHMADRPCSLLEGWWRRFGFREKRRQKRKIVRLELEKAPTPRAAMPLQHTPLGSAVSLAR